MNFGLLILQTMIDTDQQKRQSWLQEVRIRFLMHLQAAGQETLSGGPS